MRALFSQLPWTHRTLIAFFGAWIVIALFLPDPIELRDDEDRLEVGRRYPLALNSSHLISPTAESNASLTLDWKTYEVANGESAALVFQRVGVSPHTLHALITSSDEIKHALTQLYPSDTLQFGFDDHNELQQIKRPLNRYDTLVITNTSTGYHVAHETKEVEHQYRYAEATIESNFWNAATKAGLTPNQIMELAGIYSWDIDFALDIRQGDYFQLLYQQEVIEGEATGRGKIIAATFRNQNETFTAILDDKTGDYYSETGQAMKKAFLRAPLDFRRVSSNFDPRRLHPVTGRITPHRGTDYVAPVGTPIWAAGSGTVTIASYNQFNGNYVFIRHNSTYTTKYLHLTKRLVKTGQRVKQGQEIGTLGGTGRVTGPHLHYEFLVNGVHRNPRTVQLPQSPSLTGQNRATFLANAQQRLETLAHYHQLLYPQP